MTAFFGMQLTRLQTSSVHSLKLIILEEYELIKITDIIENGEYVQNKNYIMLQCILNGS